MSVLIKEDYIHYLWKMKLLTLYKFTGKNDNHIEVIDVGIHNQQNSGPDFLMASIRINDVVWHGHVEIHVMASDWYKHQHHKDKSYDNVILHIVYKNDKPVVQNGILIPTVEILDGFDWVHYSNYLNFFQHRTAILCSRDLQEGYLNEYKQQQRKVFFERLERKSYVRPGTFHHDIFNKLVARVFGGNTNGDHFEALLARHSEQIENQNYSVQFPLKINNLAPQWPILSVSELDWVRKGHRPQSNASKRLVEWQLFLKNYRIEEEIAYIGRKIDITATIMRLKSKLKGKHSNFIIDNLIINALLPYLYRCSILSTQTVDSLEWIKIYQNLPAEDNKITREWQKTGLEIKNAYESQACLEIYQQFCLRKQCLTCQVGKKILCK